MLRKDKEGKSLNNLYRKDTFILFLIFIFLIVSVIDVLSMNNKISKNLLYSDQKPINNFPKLLEDNNYVQDKVIIKLFKDSNINNAYLAKTELKKMSVLNSKIPKYKISPQLDVTVKETTQLLFP